MKRALDVVAATALVALVWVLYRKVTRLWWTWDDAYNLHLVIDHNLRAFFTDGALWPQKLFTPLEPVAYRTQLAAFGLHTAQWFVVQLALVAASALAVYAAARTFLAPDGAFAAAALYLAAVPLCSVVTTLSATHYLQSIALAALAAALYVRALRADRVWMAIASAGLYFAAMLARETVVPLLALLVVLPERDWRTRAHFAAPHAVAIALYLGWRLLVLGTLIGGYGWAVENGEWPALVAAFPKKLFLAAAGTDVRLGAAVVVIMAVVAGLALRRRHSALLLAVAMILAAVPVLPISKEMQRRYALVPWIVLVFAFIAGAERLRGKWRAALLIAVPILALVMNRQEWKGELAREKRMSDEGRVFWDLPPNALLRAPIVPPAAMGELNWLKTVYAGRPAGAAWFYDDIYLCTNDLAGRRAWQFDARARHPVEITALLPAVARRSCASMRNGAPLRAEFHFRRGALFWRFGPYVNGHYRVVLGNGVSAYDVPAADGFRLDVPGIALRVKYESPAGWVTYSPDIPLDFVHHPDLRWQR